MRLVTTFACVAAGLIAVLGSTSADAAPPTVVPSPGYDARLQEQRAAQRAGTPAEMTPAPYPHRDHMRRHRHHWHDRAAH